MNRLVMIAVAVGIGSLAACRESFGPDGNASLADREEILAVLDQANFSGETFAADGFSDTYTVSALQSAVFPGPASPDAEVVLPRLWGRRLGPPESRGRTVNVNGETATVDMTAEFNGVLRALVPGEGDTPDTLHRAFRHTAIQHAVLVKRQGEGRRAWQLDQISPQQWVMTDLAKRTIAITRVVISVNGDQKIEVTDPATLYDVNNHIPRMARGSEISVRVEVANTAGTGHAPPEFVFLHVLHADPSGLAWRRIRVARADDGSYVKTWLARQSGRERIVVDAVDSQTFAESGEYRANLWGIPYRIED